MGTQFCRSQGTCPDDAGRNIILFLVKCGYETSPFVTSPGLQVKQHIFRRCSKDVYSEKRISLK